MNLIKKGYLISIGLILCLYMFLIFRFINIKTELNNYIELSAVFVALLTGIAALAISDKKNKIIQFNYKVYGRINNGKSEYVTSELPEKIQNQFSDCGEKFYSYKIIFKITNTSKFVLKKPTITINVPCKVKHPSQDKRVLEIRSNIFNSTMSLQSFEYGARIVLSNSNIPFLHHQESIKIWVRMFLDHNDKKPIIFHLSLDSENAEGKIVKIKTSPHELLHKKK